VSAALVQTSALAQFAGSLSATATLSGVASGNALLFTMAHQDFSIANPSMSFSAGYSADLLVYYNSVLALAIGSRFGVAGGSVSVTATASTGTPSNSDGALVLQEWSGLIGLDQIASHSAASAAPTSSATPALSGSNDLILTALVGQQSLAGGTFPPTGGPGPYSTIQSSPAGLLLDMDYQSISGSNAAVSASWGTISTATHWLAGIVAYQSGSSVNRLIREHRVPVTSYFFT
jgi:hypothetical protein